MLLGTDLKPSEKELLKNNSNEYIFFSFACRSSGEPFMLKKFRARSTDGLIVIF